MGKKIKGITVEIGGDTTKLSTALKDVNKTLADTQGDLRQVNRLLKLDPSNTTLIAQKQRQLAVAIQATGEKLETLKTAAEQAKKKLELGEITIDQYEDLEREVIKAEQALKDFKQQADETTDSLESGGKSFTAFGDKMGAVSDKTAVLTKGVAAIGAAAIAAVPGTEDFRDAMSKLETNIKNAAVSADEAKGSFEKFYAVTGDTDSSVEALSNLLQTGVGDNQMADAVNALAGAVIAFPDTLNIESLADSIQETVATGAATGQYAELLDRLGISADTVTKSLSMYGDENARLQIALSALTTSELPAVYEAWERENQVLIENREAKLAMEQALADLADTIAPVVTDVTNLAAAFFKWFNDLSGPGQNSIVILGLLAASISPLTGLVSNATKIMANWEKIFTPLNIKIMAIVAAIGLLVYMAAQIAGAWDNMTAGQKVLATLGAIAVAAAAAAIALGAITGPAGAALAAAGIIGGIVAATAAIKSANGRAPSADSVSQGRPQSYQGGGYGGGNSWGGGYGANRTGAPGGQQPIILQMDGKEMARGMLPQLDAERQRVGVKFGG